jgi:hypothetical protein
MLPTTPFGRLTSAYCERQEIGRHLVRFKYCGVEVRDVQTPESLHMVDNDRLDAFSIVSIVSVPTLWVPTHRTSGSGTIGAPPSAASGAQRPLSDSGSESDSEGESDDTENGGRSCGSSESSESSESESDRSSESESDGEQPPAAAAAIPSG